jgi:hypothetical protein
MGFESVPDGYAKIQQFVRAVRNGCGHSEYRSVRIRERQAQQMPEEEPGAALIRILITTVDRTLRTDSLGLPAIFTFST